MGCMREYIHQKLTELKTLYLAIFVGGGFNWFISDRVASNNNSYNTGTKVLGLCLGGGGRDSEIESIT